MSRGPAGPAGSAARQEHYRAPMRHVIVDRSWVSRLGTPARPFSIYDRMVRYTKRPSTRRRTAPWEGLCADQHSDQGPKHARIASVILGHADPTATEKYRSQAQMIEASRSRGSAMRAFRQAWRDAEQQVEHEGSDLRPLQLRSADRDQCPVFGLAIKVFLGLPALAAAMALSPRCSIGSRANRRPSPHCSSSCRSWASAW